VVSVFAVVDTRASSDDARGGAIETFLRREDAERFVDEIRADDPELAGHLRIQERQRKTDIVSGPVSPRRWGLIGVVVLAVVLALLAWWWSTVDLVDDIGLF
jgi:hypothetical protein